MKLKSLASFLTTVILTLSFSQAFATLDISRGIPGGTWGQSIKKITGYELTPSGEPVKKGIPSFYTISSPKDFRVIGLSSKEHEAWTEPILWTYKGNLMGVQMELNRVSETIETLKKTLGSPQRETKQGLREFYQWTINKVVLIEATNMVGKYCMINVTHLPTLKTLNRERKKIGLSVWE